MSDTPGIARSLDQGTAPTRFARGWHCLGLADTFRDGKPHAIPGFGSKLVVWQDSKGELNVLDGYCRHMGGDLTQGIRQGRRGRLPVPRLALGRRRQVQGRSRTHAGCRCAPAPRSTPP